MTKHRRPKFQVGDRIFSKNHRKILTISGRCFDAEDGVYRYLFRGYPMVWNENGLRPLTAREARRKP